MQEKIFYSQSGQDKIIYEYFFKDYKQPGFFIELGALDGVLISNSLFYEKTLGWNGICIEPTERHYNKLVEQRKCYTFDDIIYDEEKDIIFNLGPPCCDSLNGVKINYDPRHVARIKRETLQYNYKLEDIREIKKKSRTMASVLDEVGVYQIDFLSLDTEGSELNVLKSIDWNKTSIKVICVEDNYGDKRLHNFLQNKNYKFLGRLDGDYIYYEPELITPLIKK